MQSSAIKLSQDLATLVNNRFGSDIQFKVGGNTSTFQENEMDTYDESATTTLYAHSLILRCRSRYFANMLDDDKHWKESSNGIIFKPNISPSIFQDVLYYIYTGNTCAKSVENIIELIKAADEMNLEELSIQCQTKLEHIVNYIFKAGESNIKHENKESFEELINPNIPIDVAIHTLIIPIFNLANTYSFSEFTQKLFKIILPHMSVIIESPNAYTALINNISFESINKIIKSDYLAMTERSVWDLALSWGCHQTDLSKAAVEACLSNPNHDENDGENGSLISSSQLNLLKGTLAPLLPLIRFSLLKPEDYSQMTRILSYFLPRCRFSELAPFIYNPDGTKLPDTPRNEADESNITSKIIVDYASKIFLVKTIFETGGITGCLSLNHLKVKLLFRASEHGFLATTFHERCDNKGPTLVLVKSSHGTLFGGVNFNSWDSSFAYYTPSYLNFLFALPDGFYRKNSVIFKIRQTRIEYSSFNNSDYGPTFGSGHDLHIASAANINQDSHCRMTTYVGMSALAGAENFMVSDYEVFAISKK